MIKRLGHEKSATIVQSVLREQTGKFEPFPITSRLIDVVKGADKIEPFVIAVVGKLNLYGCKIKDRKEIDIKPHFTIDLIVDTLASLPGNPGVDDP